MTCRVFLKIIQPATFDNKCPEFPEAFQTFKPAFLKDTQRLFHTVGNKSE